MERLTPKHSLKLEAEDRGGKLKILAIETLSGVEPQKNNLADEVRPFREASKKMVVYGKSLKGSPDGFTLTSEVADG